MNYPELQTWIAGIPEASAIADGTSLYDPNTEHPMQALRSSSAEQVDRAIAAAHAAHTRGQWLGMGIEGRAASLLAFADEIDTLAEQIAVFDAINSGVPISVTRLFGGSLGGTIRSAVDRALTVGDARDLPADSRRVSLRRLPWGVSALILPWNAPAAMAVKKLAYSLAAGAPAVIKPSSASPWSAQLIVAAAQRAGLPDGTVNLVLGGRVVGEQLVADPRIRAISMTGSTPTGRAIAAAAGHNLTRLRLELGSNNAAIVRADADIAATAASLASGSMKLSGQWCEAPRRVIVARPVVDELVAALHATLAAMIVGSSLADDTAIGPVAFEARRTELWNQRAALVAQGGRVIETAVTPERGWFMSPTLVVAETIDLPSEVFGPMLTVQPSDSDEDAVALANVGQCGLAGYVYSEDLDGAYALGGRMIAGEVKINGSSVLDMSPESEQSFFGDSGLGGHGDAEVLDFFIGRQIVGTDPVGMPI